MSHHASCVVSIRGKADGAWRSQHLKFSEHRHTGTFTFTIEGNICESHCWGWRKVLLFCNTRYSITPDSCFHPIGLELPYKSYHHSSVQSGPELAPLQPGALITATFYDWTAKATSVKDLNKAANTAAESQPSDREGNGFTQGKYEFHQTEYA
jgi:hypothetical protein